MKQTLTILSFTLLSLFLSSCGDSFSIEPFSCEIPAPLDSFFEDVKNNKIKSVEEARGLIRQGANIYYKDGCDNTLLHVVSNIELADFFFEKGLKTTARNKKEETPIYTTIQRGYYDVALFLKKKRTYSVPKINNDGSIKLDNKGDPYELAVHLILHGNLSPEEKKPLEEIARLLLEENRIRD